MNIIWRCIILIPLLFGLCLSQTTPTESDFSTYCTADAFATDEYQYNAVISEGLKETQVLFSTLNAATGSDGTLRGDIDAVVDYLETVDTNSASWTESILYIGHLTQLINDDRSVPYCDELIKEVEKWSEWNLFMEEVLSWASTAYETLSDCLMTPDNNCSLSDGSSYLLFGTLTAGQHAEDLLTFLEQYSGYRGKYYKVQHQFSLLFLMTKWFRTIKLKNTDFDDETENWLLDGYKLIEFEVQNIKSQMDDLNGDIRQINRIVGTMNRGSDESTKLLEYLPTFVNRNQQLKLLINFVDESVEEMKIYADRIWEDVYSEWTAQRSTIEATANPYRQYALRENRRTILIKANNAIDLAALLKKQLREAIRTAKTHKGKESVVFKRFKVMYDVFISYNNSVIKYLKCFKEVLNSTRAIFIPRTHQGAVINPPEESDYGNIEFIIKENSKFLVEADEFMETQKSDLLQFQSYLVELTQDENATPPFFDGLLPNSEELELFERILDTLKGTFDGLWLCRCDLSKSLGFAEIIAKLNVSFDVSFSFNFENDASVPAFLRTFRNSQPLYDHMNSVLQDDRNEFTKVKSAMDTAQSFLDHASDKFHTHSTLFRRKVELERNESRQMDFKFVLSPIYMNSGNSYGLMAYICRLAINRILQQFPQNSILHKHAFQAYGTKRIRASQTPADRLIRMETQLREGTDNYLFDGALDSNTMLGRVENRNIVSGYTDNLEKLSVFNFFGENSYLFEFPICDYFCTYRCEFSDMNARMAIGFGHLYVFKDDHTKRRLTGTYIQTSSSSTENESSVLLTLQSSHKIDIAYRDEYGRIGNGFHRSSRLDQPRLHVAVFGKLKFNCEELEVAIVHIPKDVRETPLYNVYEVTVTPGFVQNVYVAKGVHSQTDGEASWFSLSNNSEPVNIAIGVSIPFTNHFQAIEISGYFFDGEKVVSNLLFASYNKLQPTNHAECDVSDISMNGNCVDNTSADKMLYMSYEASQIEGSDKFQMTFRFFSMDANYGYKLQIVRDLKLVPSYVVKTDNSILLENRVEMTQLQTAPHGVPLEFKDVCAADSDCNSNLAGNYGGRRKCNGMENHIFGVCEVYCPKKHGRRPPFEECNKTIEH